MTDPFLLGACEKFINRKISESLKVELFWTRYEDRVCTEGPSIARTSKSPGEMFDSDKGPVKI